jgi:hypothetical protein
VNGAGLTRSTGTDTLRVDVIISAWTIAGRPGWCRSRRSNASTRLRRARIDDASRSQAGAVPGDGGQVDDHDDDTEELADTAKVLDCLRARGCQGWPVHRTAILDRSRIV